MKKRGISIRAIVELSAPHTWPAAIFPVLLGFAIGAQEAGKINPWLGFCTLAVAVLLQSAVNTLNDYRDFVTGLDSEENCDDPYDAAMVYTGTTPKAALVLALCQLVLAAVFGGILVLSVGAALIWYAALALAAIGLYTAPKISLSNLPVGELLSGGTMGGVLTVAAYHAATGHFAPRIILLCLPAVVTIGCIMLANNTSDMEKDAVGGRKTFSVLVGRKVSQNVLRFALLAAALAVAVISLCLYGGGFAAAIVMAAGLLTNRLVCHLFIHNVAPECRGMNMGGVLAAHKWIIGSYIAAVIIDIISK